MLVKVVWIGNIEDNMGILCKILGKISRKIKGEDGSS
jgi:hypothetical protein